MKLNKQIFGWLGASVLLLTAASCTNEPFTEQQNAAVAGEKVYGNGNSIVTLNISPDALVGTRSISDGTKATSLYFEVYEVKNETSTIGGPESDATPEEANALSSRANEDTPILATLIEADKGIQVTNYKASIKLAVDETKKYRIALWACKSNLVGGATDDKLFTLTSAPFTVTVDYTKATNNYEDMDAFCATKYFEGSQKTVNVVLHRPFAQLNVGTTCADYNNYVSGNIYPNRTITYSKVVVKGIYNVLDVANDVVKLSEESNNEEGIEFAFAKTIAEETSNQGEEEYLNVKLNDNDITRIEFWDGKNSILNTVTKGAVFFPHKEDYPTIRTYKNLITPTAQWIRISVDEYQELAELTDTWTAVAGISSLEDYPVKGDDLLPGHFLANVNYGVTYKYDYVQGSLYDKDEMEWKPEAGKEPANVYLTEQFKYLSMCYVLVDSKKTTDGNSDWAGLNEDKRYSDDIYTSAVLPSVDVYFAESDGDNYKNDHKYFTVKQVPVHRNWRTNLLGGLYDPEDPNDPNGPDDPSSVFYNTKIAVHLCPIYYGEFNGSSDNNVDNHYKDIWGGWFPTNDDETLHDQFHPEK